VTQKKRKEKPDLRGGRKGKGRGASSLYVRSEGKEHAPAHGSDEERGSSLTYQKIRKRKGRNSPFTGVRGSCPVFSMEKKKNFYRRGKKREKKISFFFFVVCEGRGTV